MHPVVSDRNDFFSWRGLSIYQANDVLKVGTDAVLLGSWVCKVIPEAKAVLDAGTGTGILALVAANHFPLAKICAVDIDENAVSLAQFNVVHAGFQNSIDVVKADLIDSSFISERKFDLIICNPPFYSTRVLPKDEHQARAKHIAVSVSVWMNRLLESMQDNGRLCLVVPAEVAHNWISAANEKGYYIHHRLDVYSFADDALAKRSLLHFAKPLRKPEMKRLVMYAADKSYTADYLDMSGIQPTHNHPW